MSVLELGYHLFPARFTSIGASDNTDAALAQVLAVSPHDLHARLGYRMAESVALHQLAHIMGQDSSNTTTLYVQGTKHDVQQAVETFAWT